MHHAFRTLVHALALSLATPAAAAVFCANNSADFSSFIDLAESNGQHDEIRLRINTTYVSPAPNGFIINPSDNRDLFISGGWNAGCTQRIAGTRTVIDGQFNRRGILLLSTGGAGQAEVRIEYLDFFNGGGDDAALSVLSNPSNLDNRLDVLIQNNRFFLNGNTQSIEAALSTQVEGNVSVRGNLFFGNTSGTRVARVRCQTGTANISHNTLVNNSTSGDGLASVLSITGNCVHEIDNNLFWGNVQPDFRSAAEGQIYRLRNNNLNQRVGQAQPQLEIGTRFVDPLFEPGLINARLAENSPMIDAGLVNPPAGLPPFSLDERPRLTGPAPDIGAVEFDLLRDGFE